MTEMIKKWVENSSIIQIVSAFFSCIAFAIYICNYLRNSITLNVVYDINNSFIKSDFWEVLSQFFYNLFISIPLAIVMFLILRKKYQKKNKQREENINEQENVSQANFLNNNKTFINKIIYYAIIAIFTSISVYFNHLVDFSNGKPLISNIAALIINDIVMYFILWLLLSISIEGIKKNLEDDLAFIKDEIKKEKTIITTILIIGVILGIIVWSFTYSLINIINEAYVKTNYSILDDNITFIDDNKIETDVILYQTHDYLIVSDCVIDLKSNKITIYKSTSNKLENSNIDIRKHNFEKKEIKQANSFDQIKKEKRKK